MIALNDDVYGFKAGPWSSVLFLSLELELDRLLHYQSLNQDDGFPHQSSLSTPLDWLTEQHALFLFCWYSRTQLGLGYTSAKNAALLMPSDALIFARLHERY